mgnify:CR=1 FL=1
MQMKFRAHETFYIRQGWLSKGMRAVKEKPDLFVDKQVRATDVLGIGTSMVKSLRYWLQAVGLTSEPTKGKRTQFLTDLGTTIYEHDRYIEEIGTLYLLHYQLVKNAELATSWHYFYNKFEMREFSRDDFIMQIQTELKLNDVNIALRSLTDDFNCIVNSYLPKNESEMNNVSPENNISCPFGELGLLNRQKIYHGITSYKKLSASATSLDPWVVLAVIFDQSEGKAEVGLQDLLTSENNIGKVFNLDAVAMLEVLHRIERTGEIKIVRTAGLDIVNIINRLSFQECVENYYAKLEGTVNE